MTKSVGFQVSPVSILIVTVGAFVWLSCVFQCMSFQVTLVLERLPTFGVDTVVCGVPAVYHGVGLKLASKRECNSTVAMES